MNQVVPATAKSVALAEHSARLQEQTQYLTFMLNGEPKLGCEQFLRTYEALSTRRGTFGSSSMTARMREMCTSMLRSKASSGWPLSASMI